MVHQYAGALHRAHHGPDRRYGPRFLETTYGIRKVEWKRDGCYINDEFVELNGTNLHSETGMLGNAQSNDAIFEEIRRLKEWGFDFIRMSHYPHAPAFYAACDKYGVAVIDCLSGWQQFVNTDSFKNATYQEVRDMFHMNRNYCSIIAWEPSLNESGYNQAWAEEVHRISHEEYPRTAIPASIPAAGDTGMCSTWASAPRRQTSSGTLPPTATSR